MPLHIYPAGFTDFKDQELTKLLGHVYRQELAFPLTAQSIACIGFQDRHEAIMQALRGVDEKGAQAVLICVIAERRAQAERQKRMQRTPPPAQQ